MPIIDELLFAVKLLSALGCGLMAGLALFCFHDESSRWPAIRRGGGRYAIDQCRHYQSDVSRGFFRNGGGMSSYNDRLALMVARSRCNLPARRQLIVSTRHFSGDARVQHT